MLESSKRSRGSRRSSRQSSRPRNQSAPPQKSTRVRRDPSDPNSSDGQRLPLPRPAQASSQPSRLPSETPSRLQGGRSGSKPESSGSRQAPGQLPDARSGKMVPYSQRPEGLRQERPQPKDRSPLAKRSLERKNQAGQNQSLRQQGKPQSRSSDHSQRSRQASSPRPQRSTSPFVYIIRLLILGIGVGAIAGTVISIWDPTMRYPAAADQAANAEANIAQAQNVSTSASVLPAATTLRMGQELTALSAKIAPLAQQQTDLLPGVFVMDLDSGNYFSFNGMSTFSAASMIKVPILIALFQDVDAGKVKLDETISMQQSDLAEGSGEMQYAEVGTQYSLLETATNMIVTSDNTATNMIIRRLGGIEAVNQKFRQWGLQQTLLRKPLPDLEGTNTTSPKELVTLLALVSDGKLVSMKSRDRVLDIMRQTVTDTLLPSAVGPGATVAHKTGDIGSLVGDTGIIDMPSGKRYAITAMVKRPHNDYRAQDLIRLMAGTVYGYFGGQLSTPPAVEATPAPATAPPGNPVPTTPQSAPPSNIPEATTAPNPGLSLPPSTQDAAGDYAAPQSAPSPEAEVMPLEAEGTAGDGDTPPLETPQPGADPATAEPSAQEEAMNTTSRPRWTGR